MPYASDSKDMNHSKRYRDNYERIFGHAGPKPGKVVYQHAYGSLKPEWFHILQLVASAKDFEYIKFTNLHLDEMRKKIDA